MADALSVFNPPNSPFAGLGMPDQIELARLRDAERQRTEARIATLEGLVADLTARLDAADERYADLADRCDALEAAKTPAKGAAAKPPGKDGAAVGDDDVAALQAGDDSTPADDAAPTRNPLRGEVRRSVIKKVL
jgi:hypothetical protein